MPIKPITEINISDTINPSEVIRLQEQYQSQQELSEPSRDLFGIIRAGMEEENPLVSISSNYRFNVDFDDTGLMRDESEDELTFDPIERASKDGVNPDNLLDFIFVESDRQYQRKLASYQHQSARREDLSKAGFTGFMSTLAGGFSSPTTLIPALNAVKAYKVGKAAVVGAAGVGLSTGASVGLDELALQASQDARTKEESEMAIITSTILGGILGAGSGVAQSLAAKKSIKELLSADLPPMVGKGGDRVQFEDAINRSVGAAEAPIDESRIGQNIGGSAIGQIYAKTFGKINPVTRLFDSANSEVRNITENLLSTPVVLEKNVPDAKGVSRPTLDSAEDEIIRNELRREGPTFQAYNESYREFLKSKSKTVLDKVKNPLKNRKDFDREVFNALISKDVHPDPNIQKLAQTIRNNVFDPAKKEAIKLGLYPEDIAVKNADSYMHQMWKPDVLRNNYDFFLETRMKPYITSAIKKARAKDIKLSKEKTKAGKPTQRALDAQINLRTKFEDIDDYTDIVSREVLDKLIIGDFSKSFADIEVAKRGPLKERKLNIPMKDLFNVKTPDGKTVDFIETDVLAVTQRFNRIISGETALHRRFNTAKFEDVEKNIRDELQDNIQKISKSDVKNKDKAIADLLRDTESSIGDLKELWSLTRGNFNSKSGVQFVDEAAFALRTVSFLRLMGSVLLASLPDVANLTIRNGVVRTFGSSLNELTLNVKSIMKNVKANNFKNVRKADLEREAVGWETAMQARLAVNYDLVDATSSGSAINRLLNQVTPKFTKATGISYWNDIMNKRAAVVTTLRISDATKSFAKKGTLNKSDTIFLNQIGLGSDDWADIASEINKHGVKEGKLQTFNLHNWDNKKLAEKVENAVIKEQGRTIIRKGIGDAPVFMNTWWGKFIGQFLNFAFAQNSKLLTPSLQRADANALFGSLMSIAVGMGVYALRETASGRDLSDDPNKWVLEGIDRSGVLSVPMMANMYFSAVAGKGIEDLVTDESLSRYQIHSARSRIFGAPTGTAFEIGNLFAELSDLEWTERDIHQARVLMAAQNHFLFRYLLDAAEKGIADVTGAKKKNTNKGSKK